MDAEVVKHTLSTILHTQGEALAAEILDVARPVITLTGYDFGEDLYSLDLRIPAVRFATVEDDVERIEKKIQAKLWKLGLGGELNLNTVRILPELVVGQGAVSVALPTQTDEKRIWQANRLRLFVSHVSKFKIQAAELKQALAHLGVDCFVAHEDIEPSLEWHREIEFALRSMHAICALVTSEFNQSKWCDQEVGYALGRAVPAVLVSCGADPYGLMGKHQSLRGDLSKIEDLAGRITDVLAKQEQLKPLLTDGLVDALVNAHSYAAAKTAMRRIASMQQHLSKEQIVRMMESMRDNSQVREAINVPSQIEAIAKRAGVELPESRTAGDIDDDIPF